MLTREEVLENLQIDPWSPLAMNAVIASKAEKRALKGQDLHAYTLDISPLDPEREEVNKTQISDFANQLYEKALQTDSPIRIQLAVRTSNVHWSAVDLEVSKTGVKMLQIDAAADPSATVGLFLFDELKDKFPDQEQSRYYTLQHGDIPSDPEKPQSIQYDKDSCSRFALDIIFHMSNIQDPFTKFEEKELEVANSLDHFITPDRLPNLRLFNSRNIPTEFAMAYRGTQSKTSFQSLPNELHSHVINKKGQTLAESEAKHSERESQGWVKSKSRNKAMQHKKQGYVEDVTQALQQPQFLQTIPDREVLTAIKSGAFLSTQPFDGAKVATQLVAEAMRIEKSKSWGLGHIAEKFSNRTTLIRAQNALRDNNPSQAVACLEKMRGLPKNYQQHLATMREKIEGSVAHTSMIHSKK